MKNWKMAVAVVVLLIVGAVGCQRDAQVAS